MKFSRLVIYLLLFFVFSLCSLLLAFLKMPYSSTNLSFIGIDQMEEKPIPNPNFSIGGIEWDVVYYSQTKDLEDFRIFFRENCNGLLGIEAANCIGKKLQESIPIGNPSDDCFAPRHNPQDSLRRHLNGEPGHCVNYSAITANALLASGIPAILVQLHPESKRGHNVVNVWDERFGWVFFDPTNSVVITEGNRLISELKSLKSGNSGTMAIYENSNNIEFFMRELYEGSLPFDGAITYPEPWYHTRTGKKYDSAPFRGKMIGVGNQTLSLGIGQRILLACIFANLIIIGVCLVIILVHRRIKNYLIVPM